MQDPHKALTRELMYCSDDRLSQQLTIWMMRASAAVLSASCCWDALALISCLSSAASSMISESLTHAKLSLPPSAAILLTAVQMGTRSR